ncbi:DNA-binding response regulator [Cohnella silvisoli]|uniref:DNA-binding response regulator n=1 Tax=Cohnella silvisoli TaxID=2873699 RepID=A0ABV1KPL1_9BACL|nr:DNA-binding response regulator [Cohnella silvisoli]MCD9022296.1 DNA-binding response regulator [Cohnella silvisoli]
MLTEFNSLLYNRLKYHNNSVVKHTPLSHQLKLNGRAAILFSGSVPAMDFETAYVLFIEKYKKGRRGESLKRLIKGHGHGEKLLLEKVWWPAFQNFDNLYPEYEVSDFKDGNRFLDYAFLQDYVMLNIEFDGFHSHAKDINRTKFSDNLMRQNHLVLDGWKVLRFSHDDVMDRPRMCQQILLQFMGRWVNSKKSDQISQLSAEERDILRLALRRSSKLNVAEVCLHLEIGDKKARKLLHNLLDNELLLPPNEHTKRIKYYRLSPTVNIDLLGL